MEFSDAVDDVDAGRTAIEATLAGPCGCGCAGINPPEKFRLNYSYVMIRDSAHVHCHGGYLCCPSCGTVIGLVTTNQIHF